MVGTYSSEKYGTNYRLRITSRVYLLVESGFQHFFLPPFQFSMAFLHALCTRSPRFKCISTSVYALGTYLPTYMLYAELFIHSSDIRSSPHLLGIYGGHYVSHHKVYKDEFPLKNSTFEHDSIIHVYLRAHFTYVYSCTHISDSSRIEHSIERLSIDTNV